MDQLHFLFLAAICTWCCSLFPRAGAETVQIASGLAPQHGQSLQRYLCGGSGGDGEEVVSGTTFLLSQGEHRLQDDSSCLVKDLSDLAIVGEGEEPVSIVCDEVAGSNLVFLNVTNLTIQNVMIQNCGRVLSRPPALPTYVNNTFAYIDAQQKAVLVISYVTDLLLEDFAIVQSYGFGILGVNPQGETVLHNVTIADTDNYRHLNCDSTSRGTETHLGCSGSGIALVYSDPSPDDGFTLSNTSLSILESTFVRNENVVPISLFIPVFLSIRGSYMLDRLLLTGASALGAYLGQQSYQVGFNISSSLITDNTGYSSAVGFLLFNTLQNIDLRVDDTLFERNEGSAQISRGGGLLLLIISYVSELASGSAMSLPGVHQLLTITDTSFLDNYANTGGAAYFYINPQNISDYRITLDNVTFERNVARTSTIFESGTRPSTFVSKNLHFLMKDVVAINNSLPTSLVMATPTSENSAGFVFLSVFNITVSGRSDTRGSLFAGNSPGAFLVVGGNLYLQGKTEFANNSALNGGAISMYDFALLFIVEGSRVTFTGNTAASVGGAIYSTAPSTGTSPTCVFQVIGPHRVFSVAQVHQLDLRVRFVANKAVDGGNSIYANPLYACATIPESSLVDITLSFNTSIFYFAIFEFLSTVNNSFTEIASIPEWICFCDDENEHDVSDHLPMLCQSQRTLELSVVSGQAFSLPVFPTDEEFNPVSSILHIDINSSNHRLGRGQSSLQLRGDKCTVVDLNLHGPPDTTVAITLHTQQGTHPAWALVHVRPCPPGFLAEKLDGFVSCVCDRYVTDVIGSSCNFDTYTLSRQSNANASWLGVIARENASDVVFVRTCPIGFCNRSVNSVDLTQEDYLCKEGRTGILCGACKGNLSVVFGSPECRDCSNLWLLTILLYAVAGILLVVFLFAFNFTVAQETMNIISIIFYVNLVSVNSSLLFPASNRGFLFIWVSILNLELGFPFCFYDGMTETAKASLQCIFPIYLLLLCVLIILSSRRFEPIARLTSFHGIQVLATLLYLSYSKMLRYVIDIFSLSTLHSEERNRAIWLYDGNVEYFTGTHIVIALFPAAITLVFITLYTLLLVFIRQFEQCTSRLKPLLDAYGGPFKDRYRFWFGLRLLVLTCMCLTYALAGTDNPVLAVLIQQIFLVLFMVVQAYLQPFRSQRMNTLDLIFLLNLFFIFLYMVRVFDVDKVEQTRVINALVSLAFILFVLLIVYHIYRIPKIYDKLSPHMKKLKEKAWWDKRFSRLCRHCRRSKDSMGDGEVGGEEEGTQLKSVRPYDTQGSVQNGGRGNSSNGVSSTEVTLEGSLNADHILRRERGTSQYTKCRESMIDDY